MRDRISAFATDLAKAVAEDNDIDGKKRAKIVNAGKDNVSGSLELNDRNPTPDNLILQFGSLGGSSQSHRRV